MNSEILIAILATAMVIVAASVLINQFVSSRKMREEQRVKQHDIDTLTIEVLNQVRSSMKDVGKSVADAIQTQNENIAGWLKSLNEQMQENTKATRTSLDPEVSKKFTAAVDRLSEVVTKHGSDIERFGDSGFLMASNSKKMADQISALRQIVYGGKRAEDFSFTSEDPESVRRADIENDVMTLMQDHQMTRPEAERRVRQQYATRPIG